MKSIFIIILLIISFGINVFFLYTHFVNNNKTFLNPLAKLVETPKPLLAYTFENLKKTKFPSSQITLGEKVSEDTNSFSQLFYYQTPKSPDSKTMQKVSGLLNAPKAPGTYPVIVMFRGFVPDDIFKSGVGTQPVAQFLADHGFITLAPDFLDFGKSDKASLDPFENRFQTYTTALSLLSSLSTLNNGLSASYSATLQADMTKVGIWGHSNGGHIALSVLAISGVKYPTVLWAPVSKSFPYSILYYTDESDDQGKTLRSTLSDFEKIYDVNQFSPTNYYGWIKAPLQINQGTNDHEVPVWWSDDLVATLKKNNTDVTYLTYPGADHNLLPDGWSTAVVNTMKFYQTQFK